MKKTDSNTNPNTIYTTCLGVDPGSSSGCVAILKENGSVSIHGIGKLTEKQLEQIFSSATLDLEFGEKAHAVIERVSPMRGQGVVSTFKFGQNYGFLRACLVANGIPFFDSPPKTWQKHFHVSKKKNETTPAWKRRLLSIAQNLYPGVNIPLHAADAVLLARFLQDRLKQKNHE